MNTVFNIKNFRVFNQKGTTFEISPLTFLTGCNSSGKSSVVKALLCLEDYIRSGAIHFDQEPLSLLGNFDSVVNRSEKEKGNNFFTISYLYDSPFFGKDVKVEYVFEVEDSARKEGVLRCKTVSASNGDAYYSLENGSDTFSRTINGKLIEHRNRLFYAFAFCEAALASDSAALYPDEFGVTKEDRKITRLQTRQSIDRLVKKFGMEPVFGAIEVIASDQHRDRFSKVDVDLVRKSMKAKILTYLPILDVIDSFSNDGFADRFKALFEYDTSNDYRRGIIDMVLDDFLSSKERLFTNYYRRKERSFISYEKSLSLDMLGISENRSKVVNLRLIFDLLTNIDYPANEPYIARSFDGPIDSPNLYEHKEHRILVAYKTWFLAGISDALKYNPCKNLRYVSSNRIDIKRSYSVDKHSEFGRLLSQYFDALKVYHEKIRQREIERRQTGTYDPCFVPMFEDIPTYEPGTFINEWLLRFNVGDHLSVEAVDNGLGLVLKIYSSPEDIVGRNLADFGYGISQLISILLEIETTLIRSSVCYDSEYEMYKRTSPVDYKTGMIDYNSIHFAKYQPMYLPSTIAIEEPEIHLHPRYQSLLAEMFFLAYNRYNVHFIIETHSEYLLRRIQTLIGTKKLTPNEVAISYVEDDSEVQKGAEKVRLIPVKEDGRLTKPFGPGFYDEARKLSLDLFSNMD